MRAFAPNFRQFRDAQPMTRAMEPNIGQAHAFISGLHTARLISALLLGAAAVVIALGGSAKHRSEGLTARR
jgi:hypothetical protein